MTDTPTHEFPYKGRGGEPVGLSRVTEVDDQGDVVIPSDLTLEELQERGPTLTMLEAGRMPVVRQLGATPIQTYAPEFNADVKTIVEVYHTGHSNGIVDGINDEGDVVAIAPDDEIHPAPRDIVKLSEQDARIYLKIVDDASRLSIIRGAIDFLLQDRPLVDERIEDKPTAVLAARLAVYRLIAEMNGFVALGVSEYGNSGPVAEVSSLLERHVSPTHIDKLSRAFIGGVTAEHATAGELSTLLNKKVARKGLRDKASTNKIRIIATYERLLITELDTHDE